MNLQINFSHLSTGLPVSSIQLTQMEIEDTNGRHKWMQVDDTCTDDTCTQLHLN